MTDFLRLLIYDGPPTDSERLCYLDIFVPYEGAVTFDILPFFRRKLYVEVREWKEDMQPPPIANLLLQIEIEDVKRNYPVRNKLIYAAVTNAQFFGMEAGFRIDPNEEEWPVAYIELPTGQVSWHLPRHVKEWDGHTTEEKYRRIHDYAAQKIGEKGKDS